MTDTIPAAADDTAATGVETATSPPTPVTEGHTAPSAGPFVPRGDGPRGDGPRGERYGRREGGRGGSRDFRARRKVCVFCVDKVTEIDYKDVGRLRRFISDRGKIEPRRRMGTCAKHQRRLAVALKRARFVALLPYTGRQARSTDHGAPARAADYAAPAPARAAESGS